MEPVLTLQELTCLFPDIIVQLHDLSVFFQHADKLPRAQQSPDRMLPAHQRFPADHALCDDIIFCLNVDDDFSAVHRALDFIQNLLLADDPLALLIRVESYFAEHRIRSILGRQRRPVLHQLHRQRSVGNRIHAIFQRQIQIAGIVFQNILAAVGLIRFARRHQHEVIRRDPARQRAGITPAVILQPAADMT